MKNRYPKKYQPSTLFLKVFIPNKKQTKTKKTKKIETLNGIRSFFIDVNIFLRSLLIQSQLIFSTCLLTFLGRRSFKTKFAKSHGINKIFLDVTERKTNSLFITLYVVLLVYTKNKNLRTEKKTCSTHSFALRRFTMSEPDDFCFSNKKGVIHL